MQAVEFTAELTGGNVLQIPADAAAKLPANGKARVIVLTEGDAEDHHWRANAYQQFLRDDAPEDSAYDALR